jgi:DNA polymerase-3 subunit delta
MDALKFIKRATKARPAPIYALVGDDDFLRRKALEKLTADLLGDADPAFALTSFEGNAAQWSTVKSELDTIPFLSPRRVVVIEQADTFVTEWRGQLEQFQGSEKSSGTLILDLKSFPSNTKLAKAVGEDCTIQCKSPSANVLASWCKEAASEQHGKNLAPDAAQLMVELIGASMGLLNSELTKLATFVGNKNDIDRNDVLQMVGKTREAEMFKIFDSIGSGDSVRAMTILQELLQQGEEPLAILGAFSWQLRRLAAVSRGVRAGRNISEAMDRAGVQPFARAGVEQQLRRLGKAKMDRIYDWLLAADLGMKGSSPLKPEQVLEQLVVKLIRAESGAPARV